MKIDTSVRRFLGDLVASCSENNISLKLVASTKVSIGKIKCNGMFDEKQITVATKNELNFWLGILVHESCHMDQHIEGSKLWKEIDPYLTAVDSWISDPTYKIRGKDLAFKRVIELELDCEKRSLRKIKKYGLPIDAGKYIQGANSYLFAYGITKKRRVWFQNPYKQPHIYEKMPKRLFSLDEYTDPKHKLLDLYE
jgi:hypothetical protein